MLTEARVRALLEPFGLSLSSQQIDQIVVYLELLLRWNSKINLTSIRSEEECVTRHFGESLYLARSVELQGSLLDVGSGAGFPGLALKIAFPELRVTLLEPTAKKRAFLKEAARACAMKFVEVRSERLETFVAERIFVETATARAVGRLRQLVGFAGQCLVEGGRLCLWLTRRQSPLLGDGSPLIRWERSIPLPLALEREIWIGVRTEFGSPERTKR
jgi:16S rRNA (guanine527-N7)-methyltransferase